MASIREMMGWHEARDARRELWESAQTVAHLGDLTAQWLDGVLPYNPSYGGHGHPDPETQEIADILAAMNRAGMVTTGSQPGWRGPGGEQRAHVDLFATVHTADVLAETIAHTNAAARETIVHIHTLQVRSRWARSAAPHIPISRDGGGAITAECGYQFSRAGISTLFGHALRPELVDELAGMEQVTIYSEQWGPDTEPWDSIRAMIRDL